MASTNLNQSVQFKKSNKPGPLFDKAPAAFFKLITEGIINEVNILGSQMMGMKNGELINKVFSQFILNQDLKRFKLTRVDLVESRNNQSCEVRTRICYGFDRICS